MLFSETAGALSLQRANSNAVVHLAIPSSLLPCPTWQAAGTPLVLLQIKSRGSCPHFPGVPLCKLLSISELIIFFNL